VDIQRPPNLGRNVWWEGLRPFNRVQKFVPQVLSLQTAYKSIDRSQQIFLEPIIDNGVGVIRRRWRSGCIVLLPSAFLLIGVLRLLWVALNAGPYHSGYGCRRVSFPAITDGTFLDRGGRRGRIPVLLFQSGKGCLLVRDDLAQCSSCTLSRSECDPLRES